MNIQEQLEKMMADDSISEIMINGKDNIYIESNGVLTRSNISFKDNEEIVRFVNSILKPHGRLVTPEAPCIDTRMLDGSRVNVVMPPVSLIGPMITIRKFSEKMLLIDNLISRNSLSGKMAQFLKLCVLTKNNVVVSGGTGSGKTTLLNVLSTFIPQNERIITIEDTAELRLNSEHTGRLEARVADSSGNGAVSIRQLVINSLRMRPDRIIVGECRAGEALDMLQAMNTGHNGSMTTVHANSAKDCLKRLEVMVMMAGFDLPIRAIREQVSSAVDIIVQVSRLSDGARKVTAISEITGMEGEIITLCPIYEFRQTGTDDLTGKIKGDFHSTGIVPSFIENCAAKGFTADPGLFQ